MFVYLYEVIGLFKKTCKYCDKEFESESRNTRYCSDECCQKAQKKRVSQNKTRKRKRQEYDENREINRALSVAYNLAHKVADLYEIPKVCCHQHLEGECKGDLQLHHHDSNPFNNSPWNLGWSCNGHHMKHHTLTKDVNMVETYKKAVDDAGFEDDEKKHLVMIDTFRKAIEE